MRIRASIIVFLTWLICALGLSSAIGLDFERLQQALINKYGFGQVAVFGEWKLMLANGQTAPETEKLRLTNNFFNQRIFFDEDINIWGQADYWATPIETIGRGRGDCEDFAIAKYYSLLNMGIPVNKLRLVYVKVIQTGLFGQVQQAHMVLAYYPSPSSDPLVLDNLNTEIRPATQRNDLSPIFSFNSAGLWQGTGNQTSKSSLSRWQDLLARARAEGFQ